MAETHSHQISVQADPAPEPTPEETERLRRQLETDLNKWEKAGLTSEAKAVEARLSELGFDVVEEPATFSEPTPDLDSMTKDELYTLADQRGVETTTTMTKAELIAVLEG